MPHDIVFLAVPGVQMLDVSGPLDVFTEANRVLNREVYRASVIATDSLTVRSSSGVRMLADRLLDEKQDTFAHIFLIAGAPEMADFIPEAAALDSISRYCLQSRRYGSICSGALLLAQTGLLKGKRVTTHWACANLLARYPEVTVDADALYVANGQIRTAAGVTSGLDLALRLVEEDSGREVALEVANNLVMFFRRPVNQTHFMRSDAVTLSGRSSFQALLRWSTSNLHCVKNVETLARHINLSERHLSRLFQQELSVAPAQWLERERVAKAKRLLTQGLPAKVVSGECGFSGVDVMRRAFTRVTGMTPGVYSRFIAPAGKAP